MAQRGSLQHQRLIRETVEELENEGFVVYDLKEQVPDALAIKNNQLYAVEAILIQNLPPIGWENKSIIRKKRTNYSMFDGIIFKVQNRDIQIMGPLDKDKKVLERKAKRIVEEHIRRMQLKKKGKIKETNETKILGIKK